MPTFEIEEEMLPRVRDERRRTAVEYNLGADAERYAQNKCNTREDIAAARAMLDLIVEKAPLIRDAIVEKIPDGSPLQNLVSDFSRRILRYSGETANHVAAVTELTALCANHLVSKGTLTADEGAELCIASILHDFGKLYINRKIIHQKSRLTDKQMEIMKEHLAYSTQIADAVAPENENIRKIVATHHLRTDESGYHFIKGNNPWSAQSITHILPIVDTFEVMTKGRGYVKAKSIDEAFHLLQVELKGKFDQELLAELKPTLIQFAINRQKGLGITAKKLGAERFINTSSHPESHARR